LVRYAGQKEPSAKLQIWLDQRAIRAPASATIVPMLSELLALVAPPRCSLCARPCPAREALCSLCDSLLRAGPAQRTAIPGLDAVWSACAYEGTGRQLVVALQFGARLRLAARAAEAIAEAAPAELLAGEIVPVPAAPTRRRWRGFDPADEIARALAARLRLPLNRCLRRSQGARQVGRPRRERLSDPPAVRLRGSAPAVAVLVDDVVTTGATLAACARTLRCGGSRTVVALTFARTG
jgi:ComF family protein